MKRKVSVSIPEKWIQVLDARAEKNQTSRSAELQSLLREALENEGEQRRPLALPLTRVSARGRTVRTPAHV